MTLPIAVMTGGTSGLGLHAARILDQQCEQLLIGKRSPGDAPFGQAVPVDLARLDSVGEFCDRVLTLCGDRRIDLLVLNAGGSFPHEKTVDGFERNFAVNHLAHYLMLRRLMPSLAKNARVVVTTSGTHDPEERTAIPPPRHADAGMLAYPETDPGLQRAPAKAAGCAYSSAKLANLLTAQALARHPEVREKAIEVVAYSPGPTPGTGLVSSRGVVLALVFRHLLPLVAGISAKMNTPADAGRGLADLALGKVEVPQGRIYALLRGGQMIFPDPSVLARDETAIERMWDDSARLVGLNPALR